MDVRYEGDHGEPDLILTDNAALIQPTGPGATRGYMGMLSTLFAWHRLDLGDDRERTRDGLVYWTQRNRNAFVGHPEWIGCVFEGFCPIFADSFESGDTSSWSSTVP
jgi:endonuclease I